MQVVILPNPAKRSVSFKFDLRNQKNVSLSISDIVGRLLLKKDYGNLSGVQIKELDISSLSAGLYLVNFKIGDIRIVRKLAVR